MSAQVQKPKARKSAPEAPVTSITIREFELGHEHPAKTIRIPVKVFTLASALVPRRIREEMAKQGFELDGILQAARELRTPTTLAEVEEHDKGRRIVIALE